MALDSFQQAAVNCRDPHVQIIGHPGTGKTMVMGNRIARLLREGISPKSIVALTFSNSARVSLRECLISLIGDNEITNAVEINTFHSFCASLVSSFPEDVGLTSEWSMADQFDVYNILGDPTLDLSLKRWSKSPIGLLASDRKRFRDRLAQDKSYDFDTAMELGCEIARKHDLKIQHLLIDEFQDGQSMQWELVKCIVQVNPMLHICVVGDANQEIFAFREDHLRDAFSIMRETFPDTTTLNLRYNYRSSPEIINTFQKLPPPNSMHCPDLIATRPHGSEPELLVYESTTKEAAAIGNLVMQLKQTYKLKDIAILVRYNQQVLQIKRELEVLRIPTSNLVNIRTLASLALPNLTISLLKWINDPRDLYLAQLLFNKHHKIISDQDYKALHRSSSSLMDVLSQNKRFSNHPFLVKTLPQIRETLLSCDNVQDLVTKTISTVETWRQLVEGHKRKIFEPLGWIMFKKALTNIKLPPEKLIELVNDEKTPQHNIIVKALLRYLFQNVDVTGQDSVHVRTIHSAKSREWPCVIVAGRAQDGFQFSEINENDERRLLYVAASRARERLYFTSASALKETGFLRFLNSVSAKPTLQHKEAASLYPKQYLRIIARSSIGKRVLL